MEQNKYAIERLFELILQVAPLSPTTRRDVLGKVQSQINQPFKVAIVGQSGVGKSTTINAVFGVNNYVSDIAEGTTKIEEQTFDIDGRYKMIFYDTPGLNNDIDKDQEYLKMYEDILPQCDVIMYIINAATKNFGEDCRILKEHIIPLCKEKEIMQNVIIAINKIDAIGESDSNNPECHWDIANNVPTPHLKELIKVRLTDMQEKLILEDILGADEKNDITLKRYVFYSAVYEFNIQRFITAILETPRGLFWVGTVGMNRIREWKQQLKNK